MDVPTGPDQLSPEFQKALTSPGGAAVQSNGSFDSPTKSVSVISANQALTDYNNMGTFATQQQAANAQQAATNAANKAAADAAAATQNQTDASTTSNNNLAGAITDANNTLNGGTTSTSGTTKTTASGNTYTSTGDPYNDQLAAQSADNAAMYAQTQTKLATAATTAGLSVDQQSQITNLSAQYDSLIKDQQNVNAMTEGQNSMAMARGGGDRYAPAVAASVMSHVMSAGVDQITSIQNKKTAALQQMTSGFESNNVKAVQDAYKAYQDYSTTQNKIITDMQNHLDTVATKQAAQKAADLKQQQDARDFNVSNGINARFWKDANSPAVHDSSTGNIISLDQYTAMGGDTKNWSDVQTIQPKAPAGSLSELAYLNTLSPKDRAAAEKYMTEDANRRRAVSNTTINYGNATGGTQQTAYMNSVLALHADDPVAAKAALDKTDASLYATNKAYIDGFYAIDSDLKNFKATTPIKTQADWDTQKSNFLNAPAHAAYDATALAKKWDAAIPKPTAASTRIDFSTLKNSQPKPGGK